MKRNLFVLCLAVGPFTLTSQLLPNPSFEDWTTITYWEDPESFFTTNFQSYFSVASPNVIKSSDAHGGYFAAQLTTAVLQGGNLPGLISLGTPGEMGIADPLPFSSTPDSVAFYAKYSMELLDTALFGVFLYSGGFPVSTAFHVLTGAETEYVRYSIPMTYSGFDMPDALGFLMFNTDPEIAQENSWVLVDDITFIYNNVEGEIFPNGDFENWSSIQSEEPDEWTTSNIYTSSSGTSVQQSADATDGNFSARNESLPIAFDSNQSIGFVILGALSNDGITDGLELDGQTMPYAIEGMYRYEPAEVGDSASIYFLMTYWDDVELLDDTLFENYSTLPPTVNWLPFSFAIPENDYMDWEQIGLWPDDLYLGFASGILQENDEPFGNIPGSVLHIDELNLLYDLAEGVDETGGDSPLAYPNPATASLQIANAHEFETLNIYNASGVLINSFNEIPQAFNTSDLPAGVYCFELLSRGLSKKISVVVAH